MSWNKCRRRALYFIGHFFNSLEIMCKFLEWTVVGKFKNWSNLWLNQTIISFERQITLYILIVSSIILYLGFFFLFFFPFYIFRKEFLSLWKSSWTNLLRHTHYYTFLHSCDYFHGLIAPVAVSNCKQIPSGYLVLYWKYNRLAMDVWDVRVCYEWIGAKLLLNTMCNTLM